MMAKDPAARPVSDVQLSRELLELSRDPYRARRASTPARPREPASPFSPGGLDQALLQALADGPDASTLDQIVGLLMAEPVAVWLAADHAGDAERLLGVAFERCSPRPEVVVRVNLPTPDAKLGQLLRQRSNAGPMVPIARVVEQLPLLGTAGSSPRRWIVVQTAHALGTAQVLELAQLNAEAVRQGIGCLLIAPAGAGEAGDAAGARLVRVAAATVPWSAFIARVRLWTRAATGERWDFSADALRLLRHFSRQHDQSWPELTQISISIAAAERLPLVTSWAVQAAHLQTAAKHTGAEPPRESRVAPRRWPSADMMITLAALRAELDIEPLLEPEAGPRELAAAQPTRVVRETCGPS
jgi:hypothetical protein